jgi:dihydrolipoamide dehydrogenase
VNPGGVCVYRGCIPSKALLHAASLITESRHARHGDRFGEPAINTTSCAVQDNVVKRLTTAPASAS